MHLKTNVFCGAGIVLPDKAGRQISLAGWNGASGYAVRFYTPDGSPGVNGKNDWEEDVKFVKLQVNHISYSPQATLSCMNIASSVVQLGYYPSEWFCPYHRWPKWTQWSPTTKFGSSAKACWRRNCH